MLIREIGPLPMRFISNIFIENRGYLATLGILPDGINYICIFNKFTDAWLAPIRTGRPWTQNLRLLRFYNDWTILTAEETDIGAVTFYVYSLYRDYKGGAVYRISGGSHKFQLPPIVSKKRLLVIPNIPTGFPQPDIVYSCYELPHDDVGYLKVHGNLAGYYRNRRFLFGQLDSLKPSEYFQMDNHEMWITMKSVDAQPGFDVPPTCNLLDDHILIIPMADHSIGLVDMSNGPLEPIVRVPLPAHLSAICAIPDGSVVLLEERSSRDRRLHLAHPKPPTLFEIALAAIKEKLTDEAKRTLARMKAYTGYREFVHFLIK